jgi:hypothetical protein|tara:strand:+ start:1454 stop:1696 length:243 start_codon:yes stop_codon:yes gene_type:complete
MIDRIMEWFPEEEIVLADGFDKAIIGVSNNDMRVIYSKSLCIDILMSQGMDEDEALEYFEYNISGAYVGEKTPIWCLDDI